MKIIRKILTVAAIALGVMQAAGFASFIFEEALQAQGFSVKTSLDAHDCGLAAVCLKRLCTTQQTASTWQHWAGWICLWMHPSFVAYFDEATVAQIASYYALGADRGCWADDDLETTLPIDQAYRKAAQSPAKKPTTARERDYGLKWSPVPVWTNSTTTHTWAPSGQPIITPTQEITYAQSAPATPAFWNAWRRNRDKLRDAGYSVRKTGTNWFVIKD